MSEICGNTLALDCATLTGWAIAHENKIVEWGETKLKNGEVDLLDLLERLCEKHNIERIVAEGIFLGENVRTFERLANYHGVIKLFCQLNNIDLITKHYQPTEWKRVLLFNAYATKDEVKTYVNRYLNTKIESDNITDAIGILIAWRRRERRR